MRADAKEVRSLQSGLSSRNREKWAEFASFERNEGKNSLQFRLHGGEGGIRTLGTGVSPYNGLANRRIRPLCHLSATCFPKLSTVGVPGNTSDGIADHKPVVRSHSTIPLRQSQRGVGGDC